MRKCNDELCFPVCDFCKHYNYNGNEKGQYLGKGFCTFHSQKKNPEDFCSDFYCNGIEPKEK